MSDNNGMRTPLQRFFDFWGELSLFGRFGLSFIAAVAVVVLIMFVGGN